MKKVAVVVLVPVLALLTFFAVASVRAEPAKWTPVTATQTTTSGGFTQFELNDGGIFFFDGIGGGPVVLHTTTADYSLTSSHVLNGTVNTKTNRGIMHYKMVWEYIVNSEVLGTFEGEVKGVTTQYKYVAGIPHPSYGDNILHGVFQGSGIFERMTLNLDGIRPTQTSGNAAKPLSWEGFLLVP